MDIPLQQQNIISMLGLQSLPDDQKAAVVERVSTVVQKRVMMRVFESLSESQQQEFGNLLETGDDTSLQEFLDRHAPELPLWLEEETLAVKKDLGNWAENL